MTITEIAQRFKELKIDEERANLDKYHEVVFFAEDRAQWERLLTDLLGPPLKPEQDKPAKEHSKLTEPFGGVQKGQTLFGKKTEAGMVLAMLWPWKNGRQITLKLVLV